MKSPAAAVVTLVALGATVRVQANQHHHHHQHHKQGASAEIAPLQTADTVRAEINRLESELSSRFGRDGAMKAKFVRLGFHDCVGGCDGCVDLQEPDNFGLDIPIDALAPVVESAQHLSRADVWALAALWGAETSQDDRDGYIQFPFNYYGRVDCGPVGRAKLGPHRVLPVADLDTHGILQFFSREFGFSPKEVVALMGAHTLGSASRQNSGFDGPNGWVDDNRELDNEYYRGIVGPPGDLVDAPDWDLELINNQNINPPQPNRFQWERRGEIMLNADIALVRNFTNHFNPRTGQVTCEFKDPRGGRPRCPMAGQTLRFASNYREDNQLWVRDFRDVFTKTLLHGYRIPNLCSTTPCQLRVRATSGGGGNNAPSTSPPSSGCAALNEACSVSGAGCCNTMQTCTGNQLAMTRCSSGCAMTMQVCSQTSQCCGAAAGMAKCGTKMMCATCSSRNSRCMTAADCCHAMAMCNAGGGMGRFCTR